jgi:hypothetical protein
MNRTPFLAAIVAASAIALGSAGTSWAHEPTPAVDEQCGAQGEQTNDQNDDMACGPDEKGQSGDQGSTQTGPLDRDEQTMVNGVSDFTVRSTHADGSDTYAPRPKGTDEHGDKRSGQQGDQGENQSGEHEDED